MIHVCTCHGLRQEMHFFVERPPHAAVRMPPPTDVDAALGAVLIILRPRPVDYLDLSVYSGRCVCHETHEAP